MHVDHSGICKHVPSDVVILTPYLANFLYITSFLELHPFPYTQESQDFPGILHFTCRHIMSQESKRKNNELTVDEVFSMDLPLAIGPDSFPCSNSYFKNPVALSLPSIDINMQVFSLLEKFTCVCLQHPLTDRKFQFFEASLPKSSTERSFNNHMAKNTRAVSYSLYMLHSGFVLQGQGSVSQSPLHPHRMNFINLGGLIAVYIPSQMLHLVNIGSNGDDPSHHIISDVDLSFSPILTHSSLISSAALADQSVILQPLHSYRQIDQASSILVDTSNEIIFKCSLNENSLLELFSSVFSSIQSKMSSLYIAHVVLQDKKLNRQMMEHICRTPTSLATPEYLILHLMASAFATVSQQVRHLCWEHIYNRICIKSHLRNYLPTKDTYSMRNQNRLSYSADHRYFLFP